MSSGQRFVLQGELGRGGMGVVYRAHDRVLGRDVALKTLRHERARGSSALERVWREAQAAAALNHPGVVRVHECLELPEGPTVVYELLEGCRPLGERLQPEQPLALRLELTRQVLEAMAHAHAHGVVHRDLKPDNVLVDAAGRARVTDFGLAWQEGSESLTRSGAALGTLHFMAPELLGLAEGNARDPRVDVWSLGVLIYQAVSTFLPFDAPTLPAFLFQVGQAAPEPLLPQAPGLPPAIETVCMRALQREPVNRYADAGQLLRAYEDALAGRGVAPGRPRWRARAVLLAAGLLLAAALLPWLASGAPAAAGAAPAPAPTPAAVDEPAAAGWSLREGEVWRSTYGYHARELHGSRESPVYDMQYALTLRVLAVADGAATVRADVDRIQFAMREEGGAPLVVDSAHAGRGLRLPLPAGAGFELRLALPAGRVEAVKGATALKQQVLAATSYTERMVLERVLLDLEDELMRMDLNLLLAWFPRRPGPPPWRKADALRPGDLYPLQLASLVTPERDGRLVLSAPALLEQHPALAGVAISGEARAQPGRLTSSRVRLELDIAAQGAEPAWRTAITFLWGEGRPPPLEALDRPP